MKDNIEGCQLSLLACPVEGIRPKVLLLNSLGCLQGLSTDQLALLPGTALAFLTLKQAYGHKWQEKGQEDTSVEGVCGVQF